MPRLNHTGDVCAGRGEGAVSVNGQVIASVAGGAEWLADHRVIYQRCQDGRCWLEAFNIHNGEVVEIDPSGANDLVAGGGVWAARLDTPLGSRARGHLMPAEGAPYDLGPDGTLAYKPSYHGPGGLILAHAAHGVQALSEAAVSDVQVLGWGRATWTEAPGQARAVGVAVPDVPACWWLRSLVLEDGRQLALYQRRSDSALILQWADRREGYVVAGPGSLTFRPDLVQLGPIVKVVWSEGPGEQPGDLRERSVGLSELMQPLDAPPDPAPVPVPDPTPAPTPGPVPEPPMSLMLPDDVWAIVQEEFAKIDGEDRWRTTCRVEGDPRCELGPFLNRVVWRANGNRADGPYTLNKKEFGYYVAALPGMVDPDGNPVHGLASDIVQRGNLIWDVVSSDWRAVRPEAHDISVEWPDDYRRQRPPVRAVRPTAGDQEPDDSLLPPPPPPPPELEALRRDVQAQAALIHELDEANHHLRVRVEALEDRGALSMEAILAAVTAQMHATGRTEQAGGIFGHSHQVLLSLERKT